MTNKEKAKKLHEVADALKEWGKYSEKVTNRAEWGTPEAKQIIRKAMKLLVDNLGLVNECKNKYGIHDPLRQCVLHIEEAKSWQTTKDLGNCRAWTRDFTKRHLWRGDKRSFADECIRYANEVTKETEQDTKNSGDKTKHAGEEITTPGAGKGNKPWYKKIGSWIIGAIFIFAAFATIAIWLFGDNICGSSCENLKGKKPIDVKQTFAGNDNTQAKTTGDNSTINFEGDNIEINNNYMFQINAPMTIFLPEDKKIQIATETKAIRAAQQRGEYFKYLPNGLEWDKNGTEITDTSRKLKKFFNFTKNNFTKTITGKQFKEMNNLLKGRLSEKPDFAYAWFYRGLLFSFLSINPKFKDECSSIAESAFQKADDLFNVFLERHPNDPFLLLYKGMNLTALNRGEESVSYLKKALNLEPDIFKKKHFLGITAYWNHIAPNYLQEWQIAMDKY